MSLNDKECLCEPPRGCLACCICCLACRRGTQWLNGNTATRCPKPAGPQSTRKQKGILRKLPPSGRQAGISLEPQCVRGTGAQIPLNMVLPELGFRSDDLVFGDLRVKVSEATQRGAHLKSFPNTNSSSCCHGKLPQQKQQRNRAQRASPYLRAALQMLPSVPRPLMLRRWLLIITIVTTAATASTTVTLTDPAGNTNTRTWTSARAEWDPDQPEPYVDLNGNGTWDGHEPFSDLDGDGSWDSRVGTPPGGLPLADTGTETYRSEWQQGDASRPTVYPTPEGCSDEYSWLRFRHYADCEYPLTPTVFPADGCPDLDHWMRFRSDPGCVQPGVPPLSPPIFGLTANDCPAEETAQENARRALVSAVEVWRNATQANAQAAYGDARSAQSAFNAARRMLIACRYP